MQKSLLSCLFSLLLPFLLSAQTNYKSGILVTQPGDTLQGFINYREWNTNPKEISFKTSLDAANSQIYTPHKIKYFSISGYEAYESYEVPISMDKVNYREISDANDTARITNAVFLKVLLKGDRLNLYVYKDKIKERFYFLESAAGRPVELKYQVLLKAGAVVELPIFRQQLNELALKYKVFTLSQQIKSASYAKADLLKIVRQINTDNVTNFNSQLEKKSTKRFFLGSGINYGTLTYRGENLITVDRKNQNGFDKYKDKVVTHSYLPRITAGADVYLNPELQRLIFRGEISATSVKSETVAFYRYNSVSDKEQQNTYNLSFITISAAPQIIYNLYRNNAFTFYLGTGTAFSYYLNQENILNRRPVGTDTGFTEQEINGYLKIKDFGLNVMVRSGFLFYNKVEVGLLYINPSEITNYTTASGGSAKVNSLALTVNYLFR